MGEIIAVVSQKGGVGKTTTVINLGASLARQGKSVLLVDFDPQRQIIASFQISDYQLPFGMIDAIDKIDYSVKKYSYSTNFENLDIVALFPPRFDEIKAGTLLSEGEENLKKWFQITSFHYDFLLVDCPSALGIYTELALKIADSVIVPIQCEFYALKSLSASLKFIKKIKTFYNSELVYRGFLITMVDLRSKLAKMVLQRLQTTLSSVLFKTHIPRNIRLAEVPFYGKPVFLIDEKSKGSRAYSLLADEILNQSVTTDSTLIREKTEIARL